MQLVESDLRIELLDDGGELVAYAETAAGAGYWAIVLRDGWGVSEQQPHRYAARDRLAEIGGTA